MHCKEREKRIDQGDAAIQFPSICQVATESSILSFTRSSVMEYSIGMHRMRLWEKQDAWEWRIRHWKHRGELQHHQPSIHLEAAFS